MKFDATLEFVAGQKAATLTLTDQNGEWAGASRVEGRNHSEIYDRARRLASLNSEFKGGRLERLMVERDIAYRTSRGSYIGPSHPATLPGCAT